MIDERNSLPREARVIAFPSADRKCPAGSVARHAQFGWCDVIAANGLARVVRYETVTPTPLDGNDLPEGVTVEEVLLSEVIEVCETTVHVSELAPIDPARDMGWLRTCASRVKKLPRGGSAAPA